MTDGLNTVQQALESDELASLREKLADSINDVVSRVILKDFARKALEEGRAQLAQAFAQLKALGDDPQLRAAVGQKIYMQLRLNQWKFVIMLFVASLW